MTNHTVDISPYLTDKQLNSFVEYLDEDHMTDGSFWYEISFMERHGIDIAFYSGTLVGETKYSYSPVYQEGGLPRDTVRRIALQLRDVIRREQALPPLSDDEKRAWVFEMPYGYIQLRLPYVEDRTSVKRIVPNLEDGIGSPFTDEQVAKTIDYVKTQYPEIVRYMTAVKHDRVTYTPAPENKNKHWIRMRVVWIYMNNAIFCVLRKNQTLNFHDWPRPDHKIYNIIYDSL
jgi:hypothetical protein